MVSDRLFSRENEEVEWKEILLPPPDVARVMVAFSNTNGGSILVGIDKNGNIVGVDGVEDEHIINIARNNCIPPVNVKINRFKKKGKELVEIKIPKGENTPYTGNHRYYVKVGNTIRDATIVELIKLIARGNHRGAQLLLSNLETLRKNIRAAIHSGTRHGKDTAIQKIIELCELIHETHDPEALEEGFDVLIDVSREAAMNNSELTQRIIQELDSIAVVIEIHDFYEKVKAKKMIDVIFEILYDIEEYRPEEVSDIEAAFSLLHRIGEASIKANDYETANEILESTKYLEKENLVQYSKGLVESLQGQMKESKSKRIKK